MRGNALRMEELGADVEKLDRAADRKAEEALAARKRQAELLAELAAVQEREKGEAAALAALRAERAVLMEQEAPGTAGSAAHVMVFAPFPARCFRHRILKQKLLMW